MGTIATSTLATATAYGNQRKIDRAQNGVVWSIFVAGTQLASAYSTDGGATWTAGADVYGASGSFTANASLFIDIDDYAHVVYKNASDGYIYYKRGTPNAARTAYTWSAAVLVTNVTSRNYPDLVVHRDPATAGAWVAHFVMTIDTNSINKLLYNRASIAANGAVTLMTAAGGEGAVDAGASAANTNPGFPSIDFNHTGDGKTVAGGTPHLYVGWSAGATGSGNGIRFRKATYASGSWTWGTEREIDNTAYISGASEWLNCHYDGTRVVLAGYLYTGSANKVVIHDRDASDPASGGTTLRTVLTAPMATADQLFSGASTYDALGNVWLFGSDASGGNAACKANYRRWVRTTSTLDPVVTFDSTARPQPFVSVCRGPQGQAIDYVYTDGTASPYEVKSGRIVLNQNPTAPTPQTPADNATWDSSTDQTVTFRHNDPDGDPASAYALWFRPAGTSATYQAITGSSTAANGTNITVTVPANTWPGQIAYYSTTTDPSGAVSPPSAIRTVTGTPAALAAATGGSGGTAFTALALYSATEVDRVQRVVTRAVTTTVTAVSPLTITIDGGPVTALRNAGYTPTVGDTVQAEYVSGQWIVQDKVIS